MPTSESRAPRAEDEAVVDASSSGARDAAGTGAFPPAEQRLLRLMAEFRRRQRERPDLVVRPWFSGAAADSGGIGFVVEYCPRGSPCAEIRIRHDRALAQGPAGQADAVLGLEKGWLFDDADVRGPELMANHLIRLAETTLPAPAGPPAT